MYPKFLTGPFIFVEDAEPKDAYDQRQGTNYRLVKCLECQKLSWIEDD